MIYSFYSWVSGSGSLVYSGEFADDEAALAHVASFGADVSISVEAQGAGYSRLVGGLVTHLAPAPWKEALRGTWKGLPLDVRAAFAGVRTAVFVAIDDGDIELARHLIETASVPVELEQVRQGLLAGLPES